MARLNTAIPPTPKEEQNFLGVIGGDLAGFPNGRRPGDDVVDIALRVVMGALCHPLEELGGLELGLCSPEDAPDGLLPYTDQTYQGPDQFDDTFPYLKTPLSGSPNTNRVFFANLQSSQEVPGVESPWSGACGGVLNAAGTELALSCTHNVPDVTAAHLHRAAPGVNGSVVCALTSPASPILFVCPLDSDLLQAVQRGNTYINIHSTAQPSGEIRGQLH